MPPITLLIKPASSLCNMRCKYCFYHDVAANRQHASYGVMGLDTLERLVRDALDYAQGSCAFVFQGGEPTLAGLPFYEALLALQRQYNTKRLRISNSIQTNGLLIDDAFAQFLGRHGFLVGLSLDGSRQMHDTMRVDAAGHGTFEPTMRAARLLQRYRVPFNILSVVTNETARHGRHIYNFMKKNRFGYLQFIPCLGGFDAGNTTQWLTPQRYATFLMSTFDCYYHDYMASDPISIRLFDNYIALLAGQHPECCGMSGVCGYNLVVESDGSVYPCDFYVLDSYKLGHIGTSSLRELHSGRAAQAFVEQSQHVDGRCAQCRWLPLCRGGCRRYREPFTAGKPALNQYCQSYQAFFEYAYPRMQAMARDIMTRPG